MPKQFIPSKLFAITFVILTISAIAGIVTMVVLYTTEIATMNPTRRPTLTTPTTAPPPVMRLPKNLIPDSYKVFLQPDLHTRIIQEENVTSPSQTMLFNGTSTVIFHCVETTSTIYLHSRDLIITKDAVVTNTKNNEKINVTKIIHHNDQSDFLEIQLDKPLEERGDYSLFLAFMGEISNNLDGLYLSTYYEGDPDYEGDTDTER